MPMSEGGLRLNHRFDEEMWNLWNFVNTLDSIPHEIRDVDDEVKVRAVVISGRCPWFYCTGSGKPMLRWRVDIDNLALAIAWLKYLINKVFCPKKYHLKGALFVIGKRIGEETAVTVKNDQVRIFDCTFRQKILDFIYAKRESFEPTEEGSDWRNKKRKLEPLPNPKTPPRVDNHKNEGLPKNEKFGYMDLNKEDGEVDETIFRVDDFLKSLRQ